MKKMTKWTAALAAAMMVGLFASCSNSSGGGTSGGGNASYIGTKAPSAAKEVGDIVFNDGSATPYATGLSLTDAQKAAAIAIIFYKGTGCNNDGDTTPRTLGVGLKHHRNDSAWCTASANACYEKISTIRCLHSGTAGALTFTGDKDGSNNLEQIATYLTSNSSSNDTGTATNYPAFYFAKNYSATATNLGTTYASGWYLPSIAELFQIYANGKGANKAFDIDAASQALEGDSFGTSLYWSSSQCDSNDEYACKLNFNNGVEASGYKRAVGSYLCAIRAF